MMNFSQWLESIAPAQLPSYAKIERSQGDGWKITIPQGYIDYRHDNGTNEIWWIETNVRRKGFGKKLIDLMQTAHPADTIAWGVTTPHGKDLRDSWHKKNPNIGQLNGAFEGQFDPSGNNYGEDESFEDDFDEI